MVLKVNTNYLLMTLLCFFVVYDINTSASDLNEDLEKINSWAFKWEMKFNPDPKSKLEKLVLVERKLHHCTQLYALTIDQLKITGNKETPRDDA